MEPKKGDSSLNGDIKKSSQNVDHLSALPAELKSHIIKFATPVEVINLANSSTIFHLFVYDKNRTCSLPQLRQLLTLAALGNYGGENGAFSIWSKNPKLLTYAGTIYHPNRTYNVDNTFVDIDPHKNPGRYKYIGTAYQIALKNSEFEVAEQMGEYMDEDERNKQFFEIFPDGEIKKHHWDLKKAKKLLEAVFAEVVKDTKINYANFDDMKETTKKALYALYDYVKPNPEQQTGLVSDPEFYLKALELYENKYDQFRKGDQGSKQRSFWCIRVEVYLISLLGTRFLRPYAQGWANKEKPEDGCVLSDRSSIFAFRRSSIPGYHIFVGCVGGCHGRGWQAARGCDAGVLRNFQKFNRANARAGEELRVKICNKPRKKCRLV